MKDHIKAKFINELRATAVKYSHCGMLREQIVRVVNKYVGSNTPIIRTQHRNHIVKELMKKNNRIREAYITRAPLEMYIIELIFKKSSASFTESHILKLTRDIMDDPKLAIDIIISSFNERITS